MNFHRLAIFTVLLLSNLLCKAQETGTAATQPATQPNGGKPNVLNSPGMQYPMVDASLKAIFRISAPDAQSVIVDVVGKRFPMNKGDDGNWTVTTTPLPVGFHYYAILVDGA